MQPELFHSLIVINFYIFLSCGSPHWLFLVFKGSSSQIALLVKHFLKARVGLGCYNSILESVSMTNNRTRTGKSSEAVQSNPVHTYLIRKPYPMHTYLEITLLELFLGKQSGWLLSAPPPPPWCQPVHTLLFSDNKTVAEVATRPVITMYQGIWVNNMQNWSHLFVYYLILAFCIVSYNLFNFVLHIIVLALKFASGRAIATRAKLKCPLLLLLVVICINTEQFLPFYILGATVQFLRAGLLARLAVTHNNCSPHIK